MGGGFGYIDLELIEGDVKYCVTLPCTTGRNVLGSTETGGQQGEK